MRVRATLNLDLDVQSPSEAAKVLEPLLSAVPAVEQFTWTIKGQEWFEPTAKRRQRVDRSRVGKPERVRDTY